MQEGLDLDRQALHAFRLEVTHPLTKERLCFEAPLPDDMKKALNALKL
jgi:23S rRNA pseudouridine1911/1915/1917 synthase